MEVTPPPLATSSPSDVPSSSQTKMESTSLSITAAATEDVTTSKILELVSTTTNASSTTSAPTQIVNTTTEITTTTSTTEKTTTKPKVGKLLLSITRFFIYLLWSWFSI